MMRRPPRSTLSSSSAASDVYKRQGINAEYGVYISNLQTSGQFVYGVLYSEGGVGVISGGIDVSHNHLYVVNSMVGTAWTVGVAGVIDSITQNMVTSGSAASLNITSNIVSGTNTTCNTMIWIMCNNIQNVLQNSVTTISENKMEAELVSVAFSKIWYVIRAMRGLVVNSNGTLYLTNNILTSTNTTSKNKDVCVVVYVTAPVSYTHLRAHETPEHLVCRLLLEKKK
eukprot:TRINITY_DN52328_c0_g1_i1.p1 TRINITY_DN52328_c0_g1~~TRINITY_DN52328_c0_g1_i1.p1  ORF type:complete len:227 (+),score=39.68 TRINITY_DN52328_c0_g1_i1:74-754(+)